MQTSYYLNTKHKTSLLICLDSDISEGRWKFLITSLSVMRYYNNTFQLYIIWYTLHSISYIHIYDISMCNVNPEL